ncbi:hypothetical protein A1353_19105 [Methylomonas methanica]|uniref:Response regulatory domain-containing protein n=1 Tax=Methylomonas methanica TaxID=421 RepID=A0A177M5B8_METMH|nr:response regulator [Methylomonas methanica]OAI00918.1 hypothetical protein A1353_19105 [Methylomonas methanica]
MNIIVASSDQVVIDSIIEHINGLPSPTITVVESTDDFIEELKSGKHNCIVADYFFDGIDIWQLAKLVGSQKLLPYSLPIYLVNETCQTEIPPILAKEYGFNLVGVEQLPVVLSAMFQGEYVRGRSIISKPSLLVIEDDEDAAEVVYQALRDSYEIDMATDGIQGLMLWKTKRHNLILLDYMLPGLKGDDVLYGIMEVDKNQPIIVMTAYDKPDSNQNFILNGASQYLPKPFLLDDLRRQCQIIINKSKLIYQTHYSEMKFTKLSSLVYELDHYLNSNNIEKAKRVMATIKTVMPNKLTEDDQLTQREH